MKSTLISVRSMVGNLLSRGLAFLFGLGFLLVVPFSHAAEIVSGNLDTILNNQTGRLTIWRLADNHNVIVFDFPSLSEQGYTFNRLTQLTEQYNEPYKRVMGNDEFAKYLEALRRNNADFAYGHDVLASEFALFYNLADRDKIELLPQEIAVRDFLMEQGIIKLWRGIYQVGLGNVVVLSIPQVQERRANEPPVSASARRAIVMHEVAHAEFYTNKQYADYCRHYWNATLNEDQRNKFKNFLSSSNYSLNADELLVNEMQAYMMFTPDPASFSAAKLGVSQAQLDAMRDSFNKGKPPTKLRAYALEGTRK